MNDENSEFTLYSKLKRLKNYLSIPDLKKGYLYYIFARNSHLGIWLPESNGFLISRFKYDRNYLFTEYHWDWNDRFGTVKPLKEIEESPFAVKELGQIRYSQRSVIIDQEFDQSEYANLSNEYLFELERSVVKYLNDKAIEYPFLWYNTQL